MTPVYRPPWVVERRRGLSTTLRIRRSGHGHTGGHRACVTRARFDRHCDGNAGCQHRGGQKCSHRARLVGVLPGMSIRCITAGINSDVVLAFPGTPREKNTIAHGFGTGRCRPDRFRGTLSYLRPGSHGHAEGMRRGSSFPTQTDMKRANPSNDHNTQVSTATAHAALTKRVCIDGIFRTP
jgi:hypothetical protein